MAIWQFQCNIIPKRVNIDGLEVDEIISWKGVSQPLCDITFLKQEKSWSEDIIQYGKLDETCIEYIYIDNTLDEIACRLDLRSLTKEKFNFLIEFVKKNNAMFFVEGNICSPNEEDILAIMKDSKANKFCKNPADYLLSINQSI